MKQQSQRTQLLLRLKEHLVSHSLVSLPRLPKQNTEAPGRTPSRGLFLTGLEAVNSKIKMAARQASPESSFASQVALCSCVAQRLLAFFPFSSFNNLFIGGGTCAPTHTCSSEDSLLELVLSLHCVGSSIDLRLSVLAASRFPAEPSCQSAPPFPQRHQSYLARALPL